MKIVVPYATLHPVTQMVMSDYPQTAFMRVDGEDAYRKLMQRLWQAQEDVILVEQDIVPWPGSLEELWGCSAQWCGYSYKMHGGIGIAHMLGCCRLRGSLMAQLPGLWDSPCKWDVIDQRLFFAAREIGQEPHVHRPACVHLNIREYPNYQEDRRRVGPYVVS